MISRTLMFILLVKFYDYPPLDDEMGRPAASEENKRLAVAFARAVSASDKVLGRRKEKSSFEALSVRSGTEVLHGTGHGSE